MNKKTLALLACPRCYGKLEYHRKQNEIICVKDRLAYPIRNGIPVLLEMDARVITEQTTQDIN